MKLDLSPLSILSFLLSVVETAAEQLGLEGEGAWVVVLVAVAVVVVVEKEVTVADATGRGLFGWQLLCCCCRFAISGDNAGRYAIVRVVPCKVAHSCDVEGVAASSI